MMTALLIFFLSASGSISDNTAYAISQPESIQAEAKQTSADVQTVKDELRLFGEDDNKKLYTQWKAVQKAVQIMKAYAKRIQVMTLTKMMVP